MPAELTYTDGVADFFEVGQVRSAWHREGHLIKTAPSLDRALEIIHGDYQVAKVPTYFAEPRTTPDGDTYTTYVESKYAFVTRRTDTGRELGAVGIDYRPLQNRDAFRSMEPLLDASVLALETGGVLREGADAWMLCRFDMERMGPVCREVFGDELRAFGLWRTNHTGRRQASVSLTDVRVVCANTVRIADTRLDSGEDRGVRIRHTGAVEARAVDAAQELFDGIVKRYEIIAADYRKLRAAALDEALFRQLVLSVAVPDPRKDRELDPSSRRIKATVERYEKRTQELTRLWTEGHGHRADGSAWEAYNAVVEALDHNESGLWPTRRGTPRIQALLDGHLSMTKRAVFDSLLTFATKN